MLTLTLKPIRVPTFLLTLAGRRWGPAVAGWLGGLPVVAGPILYWGCRAWARGAACGGRYDHSHLSERHG